MSETPVDSKKTSFWETSIKQSPSWAPWYVSNTTNNMMSMSQCLKHPATVRNTRGADGSWPRSAWNKSWFQMFVPTTSWSTAAKPGYDAWFVTEAKTPVVGDLYPYADHWQWILNHARFQPSPWDRIQADSVARTKVLNEVARKKWDLGVTVAEFAQTAGMVTSLSTRLVDGISSLINLRRNSVEQTTRLFRRVRQHNDFYKAAAEVGMKDTRLLENIRDGWMEVQFGIKPLMYDIHDAGAALDESIFEHENGMLVVAKAGHTVKGIISVPTPITNAPFETHLVCDTSVSCHASVSYRVPTDGVSRVTTLGLDNPASIAWEATCLSWMVDYAVGFGDWLSSFTAANGLEYIDGSMSTIQRCTAREVQHRNLRADNVWKKKPSTSGVVLSSGVFTRELLASGVTPGVVPQIKSKLSLVQMANSLSALSTLLGGGKAIR